MGKEEIKPQMGAYYIEKFVPLRFSKFNLDNIHLSEVLGKNMQYASSGKAALYHCIISLGLTHNDKILVPNYICSSVLEPIKKLGLTPIFYDINEDDLNADILDIKKNLDDDNAIRAVLVASMYGNPAELDKIESLCKKHNVYLIDDAAQSLGAKCGEKYVGTFGDAGFFSFSPGKATPGHLGAFFWTSNDGYKVKYRKHLLYHCAVYWAYYFSRYQTYKYQSTVLPKIFEILKVLVGKVTNPWDDNLNSFEKPILGGILKANFTQTFRLRYAQEFAKRFSNNSSFTVVTQGKESTNNHKLVIICKTKEIAGKMIDSLGKSRIFTLNGYPLLDEHAATPIAKSLDRRVVEIPLEDNSEKFNHIVKSIKQHRID